MSSSCRSCGSRRGDSPPGQRGGGKRTDAVAVVLLALIKGRLIIEYLLEIRTAPRWLKISTDAWLTVLWAAILGIYLF